MSGPGESMAPPRRELTLDYPPLRPGVESVVEVQGFGIRKSADPRAALRFFAERRVRVHFVDLAERGASRGELTRFVQKFGANALVDRNSKRFSDLGLGAALYSDDRWLERLVDEPLLLRMPLVRCQQRLTVGPAEPAWRDWTGKEGGRGV